MESLPTRYEPDWGRRLTHRVDHYPMVIDMNESQVRTLAQVREVLAGTAALEFQCAQNDAGRYAWISAAFRWHAFS